MIADVHAHAWPRWPYPGEGDASVGALLRALDAAGVDRALVVAARIGGNVEADDDNEHLAEAALRHPDRLDVAVEIDGRWSPEHGSPGAVERLEPWIGRPGIVGVALYPHVDDVVWLAGAGADLLARAAEARMLVSVAATPPHLGVVAALAARHPETPLLLHHLGLPSRATLAVDLAAVAAVAESCPNVRVKLSGPWYADADDPAGVLGVALATLPADRLLWGSDFPAGARFGAGYADTLDVVRAHPALDDAARSRLLGGRYAEVLSSLAS